MPILRALRAAWLEQQGHLLTWVPVCLAVGIGAYFNLWFEPGWPVYAGLGAGILALACVALACRSTATPVIWAMILIGVGFGLAGARAHGVGDAQLGWRYYGPVEGRIVAIDRSASDALRLTLDDVRLDRISPVRMPGRVRVALHGAQDQLTPVPGQYVMMTAHLAPPNGPVEPGGFDFQRHAWFLGLGAVGYTRTPVLVRAPPDGSQPIFGARMWVSARVQAALPGEQGAFATAIMTGDRSALGRASVEALRVTNLAHLLAISGLHMGLVAGFAFAALRFGVAAVPVIGLRVPAKKLAALFALPVAAGYLLLSGSNVATERAFIMVAVALVAVLLDRRAFSLRAVAIAATIVLFLQPEALLGPGFQMSFAATTALVAAYTLIRDRQVPLGPRWLRPFVTVLVSSLVAGLATAPFAAAHFNQFAHYGLLANLLSVPLMGFLVMPAAVIAALLLPFGLEGLALWVMGKGIAWILGVAHWVADFPGARGTVPSPASEVLPLIAVGALVVMLWQGRGRWAGLAPLALGFLLWSQSERPALLIADTGGLVGVMTPEGRALSAEKGAGFVARNWLENDGDAATQVDAAARWSAPELAGLTILPLRGKRAAAELSTCSQSEMIVMNADPPAGIAEALPCKIYYPGMLHDTGAIAIYLTDKGLRQVTAREFSGARLWNSNASAVGQ